MGRYEELEEKKRDTGLTAEEADELGRLMAEREGRAEEYANAASPPAEVEVARIGTVRDEGELQDVKQEEQAKEAEQPEEEAGQKMPRDVDETPMDERRLRAVEKDFPPPA